MSKNLYYFDTAPITPEPIILASGTVPVKLIGDASEGSELGDKHIPPTHCFFARSCLHVALKGLPDIAGILFSHGCDCTNRHFDMWEQNVQTPFIYWLNVPIKRNDSAKKFYAKEITRMIQSFETKLGIKITKDMLSEAIRKVNRVKRDLAELSSFRASGQLKMSEMLQDLLYAVEGKIWNDMDYLKRRISEVKARPAKEPKIRAFLTGAIITTPDLYLLLEDIGFSVVRDDLKLGEAYYRTLYDESKDPVEAISEYPFIAPTYHNVSPPFKILDEILSELKKQPIDCVINQVLKYCEPSLFDMHFIGKGIEDAGYLYYFIDRGFENNTISSLRTKLEAFYEMVKEKKKGG
jgi:benzoyl-CoA reductase/2-hydroxyglutaryl-CoA dehydratase subunit BcrC/BadD/HgdB